MGVVLEVFVYTTCVYQNDAVWRSVESETLCDAAKSSITQCQITKHVVDASCRMKQCDVGRHSVPSVDTV